MTLDLDRLEALAKAATPGEWNAPGDGDLQYENGVPVVQGAYGHDGYFVDDNDAKFVAALRPEVALALIAEVRALRAELNTPLLTGAYAPMYDGIFAAEGINHDVAMSAFYENAPTVTVYYGRRHVYTCMAEFCAEYSKEPT